MQEETIIIDKENDLIFNTEEEVLNHFAKPIQALEKEFLKLRTKEDFSDEESIGMEEQLEDLLHSPGEVWEDTETVGGMEVYNFINSFDDAVEVSISFYGSLPELVLRNERIIPSSCTSPLALTFSAKPTVAATLFTTAPRKKWALVELRAMH